MQPYNENHHNIERLEEELRKLGTPYSSPAPDDRYWAGLRVRVMERISEHKEKSFASWMDRAREFIAGHLLGTSLSGAMAAVVIAATLILHPFNSAKNADSPSMASSLSAPSTQQVAPAAPTPETTPIVNDVNPILKEHAARHDMWMASHLNMKSVREMAALDAQSELVAQPVLTHSEADDPVSLNELSMPELESVLKSMEHTK